MLALAAKNISEADLPSIKAAHLGPLVELRHSGVQLQSCRWLDIGRHGQLACALESGVKWFSNSGAQGCVKVSQITADRRFWTEFAMRGKKAATQSGFAADTAGQLFAAIGELRDNICEHSENPASGYLIYDAAPGHFEFVVADSGVGVLTSLRSHHYYSHVTDAGTALNLALSEGVSRHHDDRGRGRGFRPIFVGLANASEHLRFCSGDHTREMMRAKDRGVLSSTRQRAPLNGFFCSVRCVQA